MFQGKKILLGVTGGIASYKIPLLVRLLKKSGAEVRVILTPSAKDYVSEKTLSVLSEQPVLSDYFSEGIWNHHVHLGLWPDLMVIAPATANTLAKMAHGICDNFLLTVYYSARCPVMVFPAMDLEMYAHPSVKDNTELLKSRGVRVIPAENGPLASGLSGEGRLPEPETIFKKIRVFFSENGPLRHQKVLINAGPTYEPIDPVRYIGNRSSGKTGIALADAFADAGAEVTLVMGPTSFHPEHEAVRLIHAETAQQMFEVMKEEFPKARISVCSAAVADYRPAVMCSEKIKKNSDTISLELIKNPDILSELGKMKKGNQLLVGFALETQNELDYGLRKLKEKNADFMVVNKATLKNGQSVFGSDSNEILWLDAKGGSEKFEIMSKKDLCYAIVQKLLKHAL